MSPVASSPFNNSKADVIIRSSDGVDFRAFKDILSLASPVFEGLFDIPQSPSDTTTEDVPIVPFDEDSTLLDPMLRYCYPGSVPVISKLEDYDAVLTVLMKYEEIKNAPMKMWILACRYEWPLVAKASARSSLEFTVDELLGQAADIQLDLSATDYDELLQYHRRCRLALRSLGNAEFYSRAQSENKKLDSSNELYALWKELGKNMMGAPLRELPHMMQDSISKATSEAESGDLEAPRRELEFITVFDEKARCLVDKVSLKELCWHQSGTYKSLMAHRQLHLRLSF
ncbi:hypothetical protein ONZ45_g9739 [Pleurotus djamor]|nr:hypothetical protein ONZ45_g9739 [Pleurotus djamor]